MASEAASTKSSAEIVELDDARVKHRPGDVDPGNFPSVGAYLEAVRVAADASVEIIAERTHIKPQYIQAVDAMDLQSMPSKPFAIGFVRSYAEALGLDPAPVVERFKKEAGFNPGTVDVEIQSTRPSADEVGAPQTLDGQRSHLALVSVVAVIAFIVWCGLAISRPQDPTIPVKLTGAPRIDQFEDRQVQMEPAAGLDDISNGAPSDNPATSQGLNDNPKPNSKPRGVGQSQPALPIFVEGRVVERVEAVYPLRCEAEAAENEIVEVAFTVRVDGAVVSERVVNSSNECFDRAALNALRQWRFQPRTVDGVRKPAFDQRVTFKFDSPS
ncbi:MAG: TonB family protein [Pseudomonadota bacterium]